MAFRPRLTAPNSFGTYYTERRLPVEPSGTETFWQYFYSGDYTYTNTGAHTGNCTWYTMGRSAEIAGKNLFSEFKGSYEAQDWATIWKNNDAITSGYIDYKLGDILIYANTNKTLGHVEVIEEINGNVLTISYSAYSSSNPQSKYASFFGVRKRKKMTWGDPASDVNDSRSAFTRNNGDQYFLTNEFLIGVIHNPYADQDPSPTPTDTELTIYISPNHYDSIMSETSDYLDFTFQITISGIPYGESVSGGNTWDSPLYRVQNTGWSYTNYYVNGVTYRRATKTQTLRYDREHDYSYGGTLRMYFNITKSTGTINKTTYMLYVVEAKKSKKKLIACLCARKKKKAFTLIK